MMGTCRGEWKERHADRKLLFRSRSSNEERWSCVHTSAAAGPPSRNWSIRQRAEDRPSAGHMRRFCLKNVAWVNNRAKRTSGATLPPQVTTVDMMTLPPSGSQVGREKRVCGQTSCPCAPPHRIGLPSEVRRAVQLRDPERSCAAQRGRARCTDEYMNECRIIERPWSDHARSPGALLKPQRY